MSNRIKFSSRFDFHTFSSFFSSEVTSSGLFLRPIDLKILDYLNGFEEKNITKIVSNIFKLFVFFRLECEIKDSVTFDIVKLSLKGKNYEKFIQFLSEEKKNKAILLISELNSDLFSSKSKSSVVFGFFEFFYSARTNRLNLKKYRKFKNLFLILQSKDFFKFLKLIFIEEIKSYSSNCYDTFKSKFLKKYKTIVDKDLILINSYTLENKDSLLYLTKKHIDEFSGLVPLLIKFNKDFVDFSNKKTKIFYLGSFCLILKKIIICLSNIQLTLSEKITFKKCSELLTIFNHNKILNKSDLANINQYLESFYRRYKMSDRESFGTWLSSDLTLRMISLNNYINILDPDNSIELLVDSDIRTNLKINPVTLKYFYKKIKVKKNEPILNRVCIYNLNLNQNIENFDLNWSILQNKLIKEKCNDFLCILTFFRNIEGLLSKTYQNHIQEHIDICDLIIEDGKNIMKKSKKSKKGFTDIVEESKV